MAGGICIPGLDMGAETNGAMGCAGGVCALPLIDAKGGGD